MFAALSTVELPILELNRQPLEGDKSWSAQRMPLVENRVATGWATFPSPSVPTGSMASGGRPDDGVGAAQAESVGVADEYPNLSAYVARGEARPAYKRAFDAQLAVNTGKQPTG
jgi:glutathione S-transferase